RQVLCLLCSFFFQAEDGIRDSSVTGVQTCALPIWTDGFSPNQSLCLPQLAPVPTGLSPLAFIVQGLEPGDRVDSQGTIYVESIRGVPGGVDLWRWSQPIDGAPNANGTLPFKYEGQPDNC